MAVVEHRFRVMASEAHLVAIDAPPDTVAAACRELDRIERCWSRFLPASDISRLNRADGRAVLVDPLTLTLIARMVDAWHVTGGRYDPTLLPVLVADGYRASIDRPSRTTTLLAGSRPGRLTDITLDVERRTVQAPPGVTLDPGGIGKGLAADLVVGGLLAAGASGALIAVGGDLAAAGTPPLPEGWPVTIGWPDDPDADLATFAVDAGGVATSSTRSRRWTQRGTVHHHVIDPGTGAMAETDLAAVTVVAGAGWLAEGHATASILAGRAGVVGYLEAHDLSGLAVTTSGEILATPDLDAVASACSRVAP